MNKKVLYFTNGIKTAAEELKHELGEQRVWTLLIGGNGSGYQYRKKDWQQLARQINQLAKTHNIRWLISSSRRTTAETEKFLKHAIDSEAIAKSIWFSENDNGIRGLYGCC